MLITCNKSPIWVQVTNDTQLQGNYVAGTNDSLSINIQNTTTSIVSTHCPSNAYATLWDSHTLFTFPTYTKPHPLVSQTIPKDHRMLAKSWVLFIHLPHTISKPFHMCSWEVFHCPICHHHSLHHQ